MNGRVSLLMCIFIKRYGLTAAGNVVLPDDSVIARQPCIEEDVGLFEKRALEPHGRNPPCNWLGPALHLSAFVKGER